MSMIIENLNNSSFRIYLARYSALDKYFNLQNKHSTYLLIFANLVDLAPILPDLLFPGIEDVDAFIKEDNHIFLIKCLDTFSQFRYSSFLPMNFFYDLRANMFIDQYSVYWDVRKKELTLTEKQDFDWYAVMEACILISRYDYEFDFTRYQYKDKNFADSYEKLEKSSVQISTLEQRELLNTILTGKQPWKGLELLRKSGFIKHHWPELQAMMNIAHSKEYHPEGNVWEHTLETFRYRKTLSLSLSLSLLLHDIGKPISQADEGKQFNRHANLGADLAVEFLRKLGYSEIMITKVEFLIYNHMLPGALKTIPESRIQDILSSPYFPDLLEVFYCDLCSTFQGPDKYFQACKIYRRYLKNQSNPFYNTSHKKRNKYNHKKRNKFT